MDILQQVEAIALPVVEKRGAFIVEARFRGENRGKVLELFIDTDEGVTTDQCADVSRELSLALDEAAVIRSAYQLVVSSPGTDTPIKLFRQFKRNIGRTLSVRLLAGEGPDAIEGELVELEGETIVLRLPKSKTKTGEIRKIPHAEIAEARVKTPW
jgi:ribosome maturation factor RimP